MGRRIAGRGGGGHAGGKNAHPTGRRRDAPGRPARSARGTAQAPGRAALSVPLLRAQPGVFPRRAGDVDRPPTTHEARARYAQGAAQPSRRLVERVLALQPGVPHPIARVLEAMTDQPHGLARGLTNYGDADFSLYLRRSFAKSIGYSRAMLARPVIGIAQPRTNHFLGEVWLNEGGLAALASAHPSW